MIAQRRWTVQIYSAAVERELAAFSPDIKARLTRFVQVIQSDGLNALPFGWVKPLGHGLWVLRLTGRDGIARAIYLTASGKRVVILRGFVKKTEKTPHREIEIARARAKDVT